MRKIDDIVDDLFRRGFHPAGVAYVLTLIAQEIEQAAKEVPELGFRHQELLAARAELLTD